MVKANTLGEMHSNASVPSVRRIGPADLKVALEKGVSDFLAKPSHIAFLCLIYPIIGLVLSRLVFGYEVVPLLYPLVAGFALIGPFAAIGLYELSRRRERGLEISWRHALGVLRSPSFREIAYLGIILMILFVAWLWAARAVYVAIFGDLAPVSVGAFLSQVFTTSQGWTLILVGNLVGLAFAIVVLAISVVSFPMLVDRRVSFVTAVHTSVAAVAANPVTMALWGVIVLAALAIGSLPLFVGLAVVMPVLGHATWHLYRKVVA